MAKKFLSKKELDQILESRDSASTFTHTEMDGFWSEYQNRQCKRGVQMVSDDRGLPPGYMDRRV